jgi:sugar/nucleoside kinase (ribokinase family)
VLTGENNLVRAGRRILEWGPSFVVIKKGEHGVMLVTRENVAVLPAYPTTEVKDPTGAGDSFAGGMMGYLAAADDINFDVWRTALAYGTVTASYTIEDFSTRRIERVTQDEVKQRLAEYKAMLSI